MTRAFVTLACVCGLATGCATRQTKLIVGGTSCIVAAAATYQHATTEDPPVLLAALAITTGMFGLATLLSGLDHEDEERRQPPPPLVADQREEAWSHTKIAAAAARAGECTTVVERDEVVRRLDAEFHAAVFLRDIAIVRCLLAVRAELAPPS